jgi:hypothetical protein
MVALVDPVQEPQLVSSTNKVAHCPYGDPGHAEERHRDRGQNREAHGVLSGPVRMVVGVGRGIR